MSYLSREILRRILFISSRKCNQNSLDEARIFIFGMGDNTPGTNVFGLPNKTAGGGNKER